ncbi:MAG: hypothetical protein EBQ94_10715 [Flavobacteriales bacterium]|nr:hypothetical protein [Crocinitomicaceae bacterium]NBX80827.1 hypothetical protein [Flavobacteriales bacterium]NCA20235.1 hypothetical protein [Crocinitomicaceae bacterium]
MKKLLSISILIVAIWQIVGFFAFFEIESFRIRKNIKTLMKHSVPLEQLHEFDFTKAELKSIVWIKSHEFKINNRYYDIVKVQHSTNKVHYWCIDDIQETVLFEKLDQSTSFNLSHSSRHSTLRYWIKLMKTHHFQNLQQFDIHNLITNHKTLHFFQYSIYYKSFGLDKDSPPPQV